MRKNSLRILVLLVVMATSGLIYGLYEFNRKPASLQTSREDYTISAGELMQQFDQNQTGANTKYTGKTLLVSGLLRSIDTDSDGFATVVLSDEKESLSSVRCSMDSSFKSEQLSIKTGAKLSIKGICTGYQPDDMGLGADIILNRCITIEKNN